MKIEQAIKAAEDQALERIAQRCLTDLYYLDKNILGYEDMQPATHSKTCEYTLPLLPAPKDPEVSNVRKTALEELSGHSGAESMAEYKLPTFDPGKNRLLLLLPRGTFKSSVITIGFSLQYILHNPDARILIDSETYGKAKAFLSEIKGHLETNQKYREVFKTIHGVYPDALRKTSLWSDRELVIAARTKPKKEPTFSVAGIDVAKTGMHYDLIIFDDLHSEKNVTTRDQIKQVIDHYKLGLSLLDPGQPLIVIGTRWDFQDLYQYLIDEGKDRFNYLVNGAHHPDGSLFFPERLTEDVLKGFKKDQGTYIYSCQYENNPIDEATADFKRSYFRYIDEANLSTKPLNRFLLVDPSWKGEAGLSDYVAMVDVGVDHERYYYVIDVHRFQADQDITIVNKMFDLHQKNKYKKMTLETIAGAGRLLYELNNEQRRRGVYLPVKNFSNRAKNKEDRIKGLKPTYEAGNIFHVRGGRNIDILEDELLKFPKGKNDDAIDALADIHEVAMAPTAFMSPEKKEKKERLLATLTKPRSARTGY